MMPEEIRPASINRPRRVRSLSRDEREERGENRDRFTRELAELARDGRSGHREDAHSEPRTGDAAPEVRAETDPADEPPDDAAPGALGRNLDITT